ncbi:1521_t:CDS:2 [Acaulospora morrowiae]|uniref:1521_t:CDS:1 n=1 Tax=Acaulospora morrowiae TaxID=94023 RepID=A0A9N8V7Q5_9GLOM|nr:1521_t:CDS:2 [Acaulospora morrowiae]
MLSNKIHQTEDDHKKWLDDAIKKGTIIKYDFSTFRVIKSIGQGSFGKVFRASSSQFENPVALKAIPINDRFNIELLVNELKQHNKIASHKNILKFYGITIDESKEPPTFILVIEETPVSGTPVDYVNIYKECWELSPGRRPTIEKVVEVLENVNLDRVISEEEIDNLYFSSGVGGKQSGIHSDLSDRTSSSDSDEFFQQRLDEIEETCTDLGMPFKFSVGSDIYQKLSSFRELDSIIVDPEIIGHINNNIKDTINKQFFQQLLQLFVKRLKDSAEPKMLVKHIDDFIDQHDKDREKLFKRLLTLEEHPTFSCLIGFFYGYGICCVDSNHNAFKMYNKAIRNITEKSSLGQLGRLCSKRAIETKCGSKSGWKGVTATSKILY